MKIATQILLLAMVLQISFAQAGDQEYRVKGDRIYQVDSYGRTQYHKGHYQVRGDRIVRVDAYGNTLHHKGSLKIVESKKATGTGASIVRDGSK